MEKFAVHPKHDSKEHGKKHKLGRKAIEQVVRNNYTFRLLLWEKQNHTNTLTTPCPEKKIIRPEKQQGSTRRKASNETNCRFGNERSEFLSTALKGWDVWVGNKVREHIILQDDA